MTTYSTFGYMRGFECVGGACTDTCCSGWTVVIDEPHYRALEHAMSRSAAEKNEFFAGYRVVEDKERTKQKYALAVLRPDGACGYLDESRMCKAQARYGAGVLSDTCAIYPRSSSKVAGHHEVAGTPSCPEVARRLLTMPDAMDLIPASAEAVPRGMPQRTLPGEGKVPYEKHHELIRSFVFDLLTLPDVPVESRLFFVSYFADHTTRFLQKGIGTLDDGQLAQAMEKLVEPGFRAALHDQLQLLEVPTDRASALVLNLLDLRAGSRGALRNLAESAVRHYLGAARTLGVPNTDWSGGPLNASALLAGYRHVRGAFERDFRPELDMYFSNFAKNYWAREWYATSPNLLVHAQNLLLRIAILRFLIFGHPAIVALPEAASLDERRRALQAAAIGAVQKFSRHFEHAPTFLASMEKGLADGGLQNLGYSIVLLRT